MNPSLTYHLSRLCIIRLYTDLRIAVATRLPQPVVKVYGVMNVLMSNSLPHLSLVAVTKEVELDKSPNSRENISSFTPIEGSMST